MTQELGSRSSAVDQGPKDSALVQSVRGLGGGGLPPKMDGSDGAPNAMGIPPEVLAQMKNVQAQDPEVFVQSLPADVKARVEHLKGLHEQYAELHKAYVQERRALELKYRVQYEPLFESRAKVVTGEAAVEGAEEGSTKGIPGFWLRCLNNHPLIQEMISEKDEQVLQHLQDITIAFTEPGAPAAPAEGAEEREAGEENSFTLTFHFSENAFFDNSQLTKVYSFADAEGTVLQRAVGTEINWKPGKDVTVKVLRKKPKKGAKPGPPVTKTEKVPSFFDFFSPVAIPEEGEDIEEDDMDELHESIEQDYEVGATIRDKLIPQALRWFTGEAARDEGMLVEFEEEDDEDDDDVDSDEEDDDDDDDDEDAPNLVPMPNSKKGAKKGGKSSGAGAAAGGDAGATPECKQQ